MCFNMNEIRLSLLPAFLICSLLSMIIPHWAHAAGSTGITPPPSDSTGITPPSTTPQNLVPVMGTHCIGWPAAGATTLLATCFLKPCSGQSYPVNYNGAIQCPNYAPIQVGTNIKTILNDTLTGTQYISLSIQAVCCPLVYKYVPPPITTCGTGPWDVNSNCICTPGINC